MPWSADLLPSRSRQDFSASVAASAMRRSRSPAFRSTSAPPTAAARASGRRRSAAPAGCWSTATTRRRGRTSAAAAGGCRRFRIALGDIAGASSLIEEQAAAIGHLVALGGDHGITLALLRALARRSGPLALVHFDAHVDTWPDNFGQPFAHGSVFYPGDRRGPGRPAADDPDRHPFAGSARGVRLDARPGRQHRERRGGARDRPRGRRRSHPRRPRRRARLSHFRHRRDRSGLAPGTGTPEVGGLASWQAQAILRRLGGLDFGGMDVVEVAPAYDVAEITALAAATMVFEYLALACHAIRKDGRPSRTGELRVERKEVTMFPIPTSVFLTKRHRHPPPPADLVRTRFARCRHRAAEPGLDLVDPAAALPADLARGGRRDPAARARSPSRCWPAPRPTSRAAASTPASAWRGRPIPTCTATSPSITATA